jgi:hypothetical protein
LLESNLMGLYGVPGGGRLAVFAHGRVGRPVADWTAGIVASILAGSGVDYVELHLYESLGLLEATLASEAERVGVTVSAAFPVSFEAWTGIPRLHAALSGGVYSMSKIEAEALLAHEAMHSILHGSPEYYVVPLAHENPLAAYAAAATVKDLEANMELWRRSPRYVYGLQAYWLREYRGQLPCETVEDTFNTLRASTAWIAASGKPPLARACRERLATPLSLLEKMAREYRENNVRPWTRVEELAKLIARERLLEITG